jgi:hypothetical protein
VLADYEKDGGMAARVPHLAPRWLKEVTAQNDWKNFQPSDLEHLKNEFGVTWIVVGSDATAAETASAITCPYQNQMVRVCRLY